MQKKIYQILNSCALIFMINTSAYACLNDADCSQWADTHCACGVRATCIGLTTENQTGYCQCYGAQGNCKANTIEDVTTPYVVPGRRVAPGVAPARRAVRRW